jgi:hypothetical protein
MKAMYDPRESRDLVYKLQSLDMERSAATVTAMIAEIDRWRELAGTQEKELTQHRTLHKWNVDKIQELSDCVVGLLRAIKTFDESVSAIAPDREFILNDKRRVER